MAFIGDAKSGKTQIIEKFMNGTYQHEYKPTIGIDFLSKTFRFDNKKVAVQCWDTAGQ